SPSWTSSTSELLHADQGTERAAHAGRAGHARRRAAAALLAADSGHGRAGGRARQGRTNPGGGPGLVPGPRRPAGPARGRVPASQGVAGVWHTRAGGPALLLPRLAVCERWPLPGAAGRAARERLQREGAAAGLSGPGAGRADLGLSRP